MTRTLATIPKAPAVLAATVGLVLALLVGCAPGEEPYVERPVEELYNVAMDNLLSEDFDAAVAGFAEVERQHPYSVWATRAQLMLAFVYYQGNRYDDAIAAADRFVELHPGNRDAAYAYYLIAMSHYEQISDVERDQATTARALQALDEVVRRFPGSTYARDARLKIDLTRDHLAGKEMTVGRYYLRRGSPSRRSAASAGSSSSTRPRAIRRRRCTGSPRRTWHWGFPARRRPRPRFSATIIRAASGISRATPCSPARI